MWRTIRTAALLVTLLFARTAAADRDGFDIDLALRLESVRLPLRDTRFTYDDGKTVAGATNLDAVGAQLGLDRPSLSVVSLLLGTQFLRYGTFHIAVGGGWGHGDTTPTDARATSYAWTPPRLEMLQFAAAPGAALAIGPIVLGFQTALGARVVGVELPGAAPVPCGRKGSSSHATCTPSTGDALGFVEPRATAEYDGREGNVRPFVQLMGGVDLVPVGAFTVGLAVGVHVGDAPKEIAQRE
jgi:hypothetical protein